jgi:hypothetical protein
MAKVIVKVLGSAPREIDADSVGELKSELGLDSYSASVNGDPADSSTELSEGQLVTFAPSVKGGAN